MEEEPARIAQQRDDELRRANSAQLLVKTDYVDKDISRESELQS